MNAPAEAVPPTQEKSDYRGYEDLNPSLSYAGIAHLAEHGYARRLAAGDHVYPGELPHLKKPEYLRGTLEYLYTQGLLDRDLNGNYFATPAGRKFFSRAEIVQSWVGTYAAVKDTARNALSSSRDGDPLRGVKVPKGAEDILLHAEAPLSIAYLYEIKIAHGPHQGKKLGAVLSQGAHLTFEEVQGESPGMQAFSDLLLAINNLKNLGLLFGEGFEIQATEKGKKALKAGSFALLILSYYEAFAHLQDFMTGRKTYGHGKDINRDGFLNALGSNGMTRERVAPYIISSLDSVPQLSERLAAGAAYLDYGSGGGDMLVQAAARVQKLFGIDVNPEANRTAQECVDAAGFREKITLETGSILDKEALLALKEKISASGANGVVASINAILHDVGPEAAEKFLQLHAEVFGDAPLIITEILRIPPDVVRRHPNRKTAAFQYIHDISGQHLYFESELREILKKCGYTIIAEKTHSSIPGAAPGARMPVDVTWIVQKQK